jgi:hypothetical protein
MGGGGGTYVGFAAHFAANLQKLTSSTNGTYAPSGETGTQIIITGTPKANLGYGWTVVTTVYTDSMTTVISGGP